MTWNQNLPCKLQAFTENVEEAKKEEFDLKESPEHKNNEGTAEKLDTTECIGNIWLWNILAFILKTKIVRSLT